MKKEIQDNKVITVLDRLHKAAKGDGFKVMKALAYGLFTKIKPEHASSAYLPVSRKQGAYLYQTVVENKYKNIVEFGTSFGISTIYLAAGARETGGKVITSEIVKEKCEKASQNFENAGLSQFIELREGDALETLKNIDFPIDFLLLDGWKDLYLPIFRLLEPLFHSKTKIFVDNTGFKDVRNFLKVVEKEPNYLVESLALDKGGSALITLK
ncbi:MAG: class I SAM-dependent methyltransferase [Saprospiraceae bacterium]